VSREGIEPTSESTTGTHGYAQTQIGWGTLKRFRKAWVVAVLLAHCVDPRWRKGAYKDLSTCCQQRFRDINLHWHDLRHEYVAIGAVCDGTSVGAENAQEDRRGLF
jgi:hypothetical protein